MIDPQHKAVGLLALLTQLDEAGDQNAVRRIAQNRMVDQRGLKCRDSKACGDGQESETDNEADWAVTQQHGDSDGGDCGR